MASSVRKNTVKLVFGPGTKGPSHLEVFKFCVDNLKLSVADIHSIYKDENGGQFYVKLVDEATFSAFISDSDESYRFVFDGGSTADVRVEQASQIFRYVRIFGLPPEVEDSAIQYVLGKYGTIRQHVRERFPSELKINIFTGVRGVHMEVSTEIPAHLYVGHFRARIYYDGLKNKCFYCKAEGHVKADCPKLAILTDNEKSSSTTNGQGSSHASTSQAGVGTNVNPLGRPNKPIIDRSIPKTPEMTNLNSLISKKNDATSEKSGSSILTKPTSIYKPEFIKAMADAVAKTDKPKSVEPTTDTPKIDKPIVATDDTTTATDTVDLDTENENAMDHEVSEIDRMLRLKRTKNEDRSNSTESSASDDRRLQENRVEDATQGKFIEVPKKKGRSKKNKR